MSEQTGERMSIGALESFVTAILAAGGVTDDDAAIVAAEVVDAEARGYESQGLVRVASYVAAARDGATTSPTSLELVRESPSAVAWDANHGWGHVATMRAMDECARRARGTGACIGTIRHAGHIGRLGYYVERAAELGVIGFVACSGNTSSAVVAPWGGREPRLSTNPFAFGFPYPGGDDVVVDVSTTQAARGKVLVAAASGSRLPDGWAFDASGSPTNDPHSALPPKGTLAPVGGHKGYALGIVVEFLCGALGGTYPPSESTVFVAAYDYTRVTTAEEYDRAVREVDELMRSSALRPGFDSIRLPGAGSAERRRDAERDGVRLAPAIWDGVCEAARSVGVDAPARS
jgi:LDH2 family malate/lactate/ureidoglycolate dehydrogenase